MSPVPITTLLVDDASDIRTILRIALRTRGGFEVVGEAEDGAAAIEQAARLRPDLIVLDLGLPDLTARDLLARLRRVSPTSSIVIFSGSETDRPWFEQRAAGYVVKDADIDHLVNVLLEIGSAQDHAEAALELPGDVIAAQEARAVVRDVLDRWGYRELIEDASLVVSELVTNAVEHARSSCAVILNRSEGGVRIEVRDHGPGTPNPQRPSATAEGGRGLMIVSALATAWGTQATPQAKSVWVELTAPRQG